VSTPNPILAIGLTAASVLTASLSQAADTKPAATMADVLKASKPTDWRPLDPQNTLYMELPTGRVIIELAPAFAPNHVQNIQALVREKYFDGLAVMRSQDNYVAQWGDPNGDESKDAAKAKPIRTAKQKLPAEFTVAISKNIPFTRLPDGDGYAPEVGFSDGFWSARDSKSGRTWLTHCYGAVGSARGNDADTGSGSSLYAVTGNAPRNLDRNITVVGRVVKGMELLSSLPRGTGRLGFYEQPEQMLPVRSVRLAADVAQAERSNIEVMRTDTKAFADLVESRRNRREEWYKYPAGYVDLCGVPIPTRDKPAN
jgi:peptidylprolyl isomerase